MPLRVPRAPSWLALFVLGALALPGCEWDVGYLELADHSAANSLIQAGELPAVLPPSATAIRLRIDHDQQLYGGHFSIPVADVVPLLARLRRGLPSDHPYPIDDDEWASLSAEGFVPGMLDGSMPPVGPGTDIAVQWVISCELGTGQCRFFGWPKNSPFL